jgi:hypothetical protein
MPQSHDKFYTATASVQRHAARWLVSPRADAAARLHVTGATLDKPARPLPRLPEAFPTLLTVSPSPSSPPVVGSEGHSKGHVVLQLGPCPELSCREFARV